MVERAEQMAFLVIAFSIPPSEVRNLTGYEVEALMKKGKEAKIIE